MLRALRRTLRPGGRLAFTTIELAEGLSQEERRAALAASPRSVWARRPYLHLLTSAGFTQVGHRDATDEYLETARGWFTVTQRLRDRVVAVQGEAFVQERLQTWRGAVDAIERGRLRRGIYWGARP